VQYGNGWFVSSEKPLAVCVAAATALDLRLPAGWTLDQGALLPYLYLYDHWPVGVFFLNQRGARYYCVFDSALASALPQFPTRPTCSSRRSASGSSRRYPDPDS
jgi:hypothetical protein